MKTLLNVIVLLLTVGCVKTGVMMLTDAKYPPKPKNYNVEVFFDKEPTRPYKKIAIADATKEIEAKESRVEAVKDIMEKLRKECRESGADAIIVSNKKEFESGYDIRPSRSSGEIKVSIRLEGYCIVWE